ncbi:MAG: Prenyltransferase/squalene oxidase [Parcubacteria group bacterium Gr01-1014_8]|nr:MAG: Prenyltransferase/squalene oxidase [Parcubacteria group bacterium Gr01-1014_8]
MIFMIRKIIAGFVTVSLLSPMGFGIAQEALAEPETGKATITIRHGTTIVWTGEASFPLSDATTTISSTSGDAVSAPARSLLSALVATDAAENEFAISDIAYFSSFDSFLINCITAPAVSAEPQCHNWQYVVNDTYPQVGTDDYLLQDGDTVFLYFGTPRRFSVAPEETVPTIPVHVSVEEYDYTDGSWHPLSGSTVGATLPNSAEPWNPTVVKTATSDESGIASIKLDSADTYNIGLAEDFYASTTPLVVRELAESEVIVRIRNGDDLAYQGVTTIAPGTTTIQTTLGTSHDVSGSSALTALWNADQASEKFSISDLQYFDSYGSFYIRCITLAAEACDNWQYAVNGSTPGVGADSYTLSGGEQVFFFFGYPRRVSLSDNEVAVNESFTATAERYVPLSNSYAPVEESYTIGITETNPDDPFTPLEIATSSVNASGQATFSLSIAGNYAVGIQEDFYFPSTALAVTEAAAPPSSGGGSTDESPGGGGPGTPTSAEVNVGSALAFLVAVQNEGGSFSTSILSDWAAIAFMAGNASQNAKDILRQYLGTNSTGLSSVTDYERRAMALMALGVNPYRGASIDYIQKILTYFDGTQFGDISLVNDDIFALFPLRSAGYGAGDATIQQTTAFVLSKQRADGSWEGSVDLTAAAMQALVQVSSLDGVAQALERARTYLHSKQQTSGGFENGQSTSWALQAIAALGDSMSSWTINGKTPEDYLASLQQTDGGLETMSTDPHQRLWSTEYAIPAALGRTWDSVLQDFTKPSTSSALSGSGSTQASGGQTTTSTTSAATSTPPTNSQASTTPLVLGISTSTVSTSSPQAIPEIILMPPVVEKKATVEKATIKKDAPKQKMATSTLPVPPPLAVLPPPSNTAQVAAAGNVETSGLGSKVFGFFKKLGSFFYNLLF